MTPVKQLCYQTSLPIFPLNLTTQDILFEKGKAFHSASALPSGNAMHDALQFGREDRGLAPMLKRFRDSIGAVGYRHTSDREVYYKNLCKGRIDWDHFSQKWIQIVEFKWAIDGIPDVPRDVDVKQVACYSHCMSHAFPTKNIWVRLAYFFGGNKTRRAQIRIFNFQNSNELNGIARRMLERF